MAIQAGKNLKPYQGLKLLHLGKAGAGGVPSQAGKNLKPYQGLKRHCIKSALVIPSRKKPKTLSGIESRQKADRPRELLAGKNLKPYQGLKQSISKYLYN